MQLSKFLPPPRYSRFHSTKGVIRIGSKEGGFPVLQLRSSEITLGFSGAPVWDKVLHVIVGMIVSITHPDPSGRMNQTAFIIPVETLRKVCPELRLSKICPYRGLEVFEANHANYYFGRETASQELLHLLSRRDFVAVVGVSGSGKSSLVQAGLTKGLQMWPVPGLVKCLHCLLTPGSTPLLNLVLALAHLPEQNIKHLAKSFNIQTYALVKEGAVRHKANDALNAQSPKTIGTALRKLFQSKGLLLIVDQFERLYTECRDETIRNQFIDTLLFAAGDKVKVLLTLRADFYAQALAHTGLAQVIKDNQMTLLPMNEVELRQAIVEPARTSHRSFQPGLVERLIADVQGRAGDLPLLEFALTEVWERDAETGVLTLTSYESLGYDAPGGKHFPGLQGAIAQRAEEVWQNLSEEDKQAAKRVFLGLIIPGMVDERGKYIVEDTSRRAWQTELDERAQQVVEQLVAARLLTTGSDPLSEHPTVEVAHEALIRAWPRLQNWIENHRPFIHWYKHELAPSLHRWLEKEKHPDFLLPGSMLDQARYWLRENSYELSGSPEEYIQTSIMVWEQKQAARERSRRWITLVSLVAAIVLAFLLLVVGFQWRITETRRQETLARQLAAQAEILSRQKAGLLTRGVLLAVESLRRSPSLEGDHTLRRGLTLLPRSVARVMHEDEVYTMAFSSDGKRLTTVSLNGTARVWDVSTGQEVAQIAHESATAVAAFSPDGRWLAVADWDGTTQMWEIPGGEKVVQVKNEDRVLAIVFSSDGKLLATGGLDGRIKVWATATGRAVAQLKHGSRILAIAFSPDDKRLAVASGDPSDPESGETRLWEVATGQMVLQWDLKERNSNLAFSPDGNLLAAVSRNLIMRIWRLPTGEELAEVNLSSTTETVIFSPDGNWLVTGGVSKAQIWHPTSGRKLAEINHEDGESIYTVAFSPDNHWLATGGSDHIVRVWEIGTFIEVLRMTPDGYAAQMAHDDEVYKVIFSPDGNWLATAGKDGSAQVWEIADAQDKSRVAPWRAVSSVAFSRDGQRLATANPDLSSKAWVEKTGTASVWSMSNGEELIRVPHGKILQAVALDSDGQWLATAGDDDVARIWEVATGQEVAQVKHGSQVEDVIFSPDGQWLATASLDHTVRLIEVATGQEVANLEHEDRVYAVDFSPDGNFLATGGRDNTARIWEVPTRQLVAIIPHNDRVHDVAFSPNGKLLATATGLEDHAARVWGVETEQEIISMVHEDRVWSLAFSPDGKWLATGSDDNMVRVWEVATGQEIKRIERADIVHSVVFSPDGQWLVTDGDGRPLVNKSVWPSLKFNFLTLSIDDLISDACSCLPRNLTKEEWEQYLPGEIYRPTCPNLPIP